MMKSTTLQVEGYERVVHFEDEAARLNAVIAVHDTTLGPALGGCRMYPFANETEAVNDALRLSKAMTCKNALAGIAHGGGKAVVIGRPDKDKSAALWHAFGTAVNAFAGTYYTAEDVGTSVADMEEIATVTAYVTGRMRPRGGSGDPSPYTAYGVFQGIKRAVAHKLARTDLRGTHVIVKGLGHVGWELCRLLSDAGALLVVADIDSGKVERAVKVFDAHEVHHEEAFAKATDVYAPCALGGEFNSVTAALVQASVVAGAANNQLSAPQAGQILHDRGILYVPDYVLNSGGVISVAAEIKGDWARERVKREIDQAMGVLLDIFARSQAENLPTFMIADELALERLRQAKAIAGRKFSIGNVSQAI